MEKLVCLIQFGALFLCCIFPMSILWWQYSLSGEDIITLNGTITNIETTLLDDCDVFSKSDYLLNFYYEYEFKNKTYTSKYEVCETNDGTKTQLKLHPINSTVIVYINPDNPNTSQIKFSDLMNNIILGFAITFTIMSIFALSFLTCCFETLTQETKKFLIGKISKSVDTALGSI